MGGDDQDKDGKYSFDEFKTVLESHQEMKDILLKIADATAYMWFSPYKIRKSSLPTRLFGHHDY